MNDTRMPHPGHDKHLCYLNNLRFQESNPEDFKEMVKNPQYFCKNCSRVATDSKNLCKPEKL
jgi:hypothetical protein